MSMSANIVVAELADEADRDAIFRIILEHNRDHAQPTSFEPVAILLKDDDGMTIGGLWAKCYYDWMFVEYLAVPRSLRGQNIGARIMAAAEARAAALGCVGLWLDTFAFQAPGFYEKLGFTIFGRLPNHPVGGERLFFMKRLSAEQA